MSFNKMALALKGNIRQLEGSGRKYRGLVDSMQTAYSGRPRRTIGFVNPARRRLSGSIRKTARSERIYALFHDE